jgi:hypothetical protein
MGRSNISLALLLFGLVFSMALSGCVTPDPVVVYEPVEVKVAVSVPAKIPDELVVPVSYGPLPIFIKPTDPNAKAALSEEGLINLRALLNSLKTRADLWQIWADSQKQLSGS